MMAQVTYLPKKVVPIIRVNGDLGKYVNYVDSGYSLADEKVVETPGAALTREQWLDKLYVIRSAYPVTLARIQAASETLVSVDDLAFMWDLIVNLKAYYDSPDDLYFTISKNAAFQLETMEFVIQGYSPDEAMARALNSIASETFESREAMLVRINQMSAEWRAKLKAAEYSFNNATGAPGTDYSTGSGGSTPPAKRNNTTFFLIVGIIILIANSKRK